MKKQLLLFSIIIFSLHCYSQNSYQKGYYITNADQRISCLIKNVDWKNNPTTFDYRLSENGETQKINIKLAKEFGIDSVSKYIRRKVNIDRSSENIQAISKDRKAIFQEEELFLKVLVEGEASLYLYESGNLRRFFYNKRNMNVEQLIYKSYKTSNHKIAKNYRFKNQLLNNLKCSTLKIKKVGNLEYRQQDLVSFFVEYNRCKSEEYIIYGKKEKRDLLNLSLRPGLNISTLSIENIGSNTNTTDFSSELTFRFGVEGEFIMPFNNNKWALILEPTYQYYKSEANFGTQSVAINYNSIELPIGIRHYFFLDEGSKIFIDGSFIFDITNNSSIRFESSSDLEIKTGSNAAFGIGYKYDDTYSLELRYQTPRETLNNLQFWTSAYQTFSIILGYTIF